MNLNKCYIIGRCTEKPELKPIGTNTQVTKFTVATSRKYTTINDQKKEETEFHGVVLWGKLAQVAASYLDKGSLVMIEGRLRTRKWEKDGQKHSVTEIIGESLQLGPKPVQAREGEVVNPSAQEILNPEEIDPNSLPF